MNISIRVLFIDTGFFGRTVDSWRRCRWLSGLSDSCLLNLSRIGHKNILHDYWCRSWSLTIVWLLWNSTLRWGCHLITLLTAIIYWRLSILWLLILGLHLTGIIGILSIRWLLRRHLSDISRSLRILRLLLLHLHVWWLLNHFCLSIFQNIILEILVWVLTIDSYLKLLYSEIINFYYKL